MLNSPVQDFWIGMVLTIRAFRPDDIKDVCRIEEESFRDPWPCYMFTYLHMKNPESIKVAVIDGRLVGYVVVDIEMRRGKKVGHILNLAVEQGFRRMGIGRALMEEAISYVRRSGADEVWLEVRDSNIAARKFYSSMGFVEKGRIHRYYRDEDAIIMYKEIE
ncbi:MAG: ribosomal protein S18-alanine N-acetyltransferase [Thaumarchaeota archaeon]|nr:ribosomal protein S18-alanine N-acetyltransferase [Candidatus Terraquivivens yellowstonensis]MCL7399715.1 ribosomal protein S18-alanine N-acetyltransferase [Candidatus Terraquivivens yellowstonensis]